MENNTRLRFNAMVGRIATMNGIASEIAGRSYFTVEPSVQQRLENRMQESSDFLNRINIVGVTEKEGEKLGLGISGTIAGRTDTAGGNVRGGIDPTTLDDTRYNCVQTNFDTGLTYARLDAWAKFPDFEQRIRDVILKRQALDRIMIGFNGTSAAAQTDRAVNPLLQDVNIGWLEKMRTENAARVADQGATAGKLTYGDGAGADYKTLDALVWDVKESMLQPWAVADTELVALVSGDLLHDKYFPMVNAAEAPTEQLARDVIMSTKRLGGLPAIRVPHFPNGKVLVTRFDNLSIYYQDGKRRRMLKDEPERDRVMDYQSSNEAYVIEDYGYAAMAENIELLAAV